MTVKLNEGILADIVGTWYLGAGESYEEAVQAFQTWLEQQKEDAHIEALDGMLGQLQIREDFMGQMGFEPFHVEGFREARWRVLHGRNSLSALYKNRRRFAERDRKKAEEAKNGAE